MQRRWEREFVIAVDLGKLQDHSVIAVVERYSEWERWDPYWYTDLYKWRVVLRHLERVQLGTAYPRVVERVREVVLRSAEVGKVTLVVDATGVGEAVMDLFRVASLPCDLIGVTITAGERAVKVKGQWHVPRRELLVGLQTMVAQREVEAAGDLRMKGPLLEEVTGVLRNLQHEGAHDDLVVAFALACWRLRQRPRVGERGQALL